MFGIKLLFKVLHGGEGVARVAPDIEVLFEISGGLEQCQEALGLVAVGP